MKIAGDFDRGPAAAQRRPSPQTWTVLWTARQGRAGPPRAPTILSRKGLGGGRALAVACHQRRARSDLRVQFPCDFPMTSLVAFATCGGGPSVNDSNPG